MLIVLSTSFSHDFHPHSDFHFRITQFHHPYFQRGRPDLLHMVRRKVQNDEEPVPAKRPERSARSTSARAQQAAVRASARQAARGTSSDERQINTEHEYGKEGQFGNEQGLRDGQMSRAESPVADSEACDLIPAPITGRFNSLWGQVTSASLSLPPNGQPHPPPLHLSTFSGGQSFSTGAATFPPPAAQLEGVAPMSCTATTTLESRLFEIESACLVLRLEQQELVRQLEVNCACAWRCCGPLFLMTFCDNFSTAH